MTEPEMAEIARLIGKAVRGDTEQVAEAVAQLTAANPAYRRD